MDYSIQVHSPGSGATAPPPPASNVSFEHHSNVQRANIPGYNRAAEPYRQYNSPSALYSPNQRANEYLMQTGGLFGTE